MSEGRGDEFYSFCCTCVQFNSLSGYAKRFEVNNFGSVSVSVYKDLSEKKDISFHSLVSRAYHPGGPTKHMMSTAFFTAW